VNTLANICNSKQHAQACCFAFSTGAKMKTHIERRDAQEFELHKFTAEASTLGWRPGERPGTLTTELGNGLPLYLFADNGDQFIYRQEFGIIRFYVWND
jgi:hypothetical protein